ncbi:hypothetical protein [Zavarzinia sp.]|uniref:hypothetical protein n=1 Tax=Zavarzinia sp. TaxID=2027920 RepID=UPI003564DE76
MEPLQDEYAAVGVPRQRQTADLVVQITKWTAGIAAIISAGQALVALIDGHYKAVSEEQLSRIQANSNMAKDILGMLTGHDISPDSQLTLLNAIAELDDHPLRAWAAKEYERRDTERRQLLDATIRSAQAALIVDTQKREETRLEGEIDRINIQLHSTSDPEKIGPLKSQLEDATRSLREIKERGSAVLALAAEVTQEPDRPSAQPPAASVPPSNGQGAAQPITSFMLMRLAPEAAKPAVAERFIPVAAALDGAHVSDFDTWALVLAAELAATDWFTKLDDAAFTRGISWVLTYTTDHLSDIRNLIGKDDYSAVLKLLRLQVDPEVFKNIYGQLIDLKPVAPANYTVFIQFAGFPRADVTVLAFKLLALGWKVERPDLGGERTSAAVGTHEVRYGAPQDRAAARELARILNDDGRVKEVVSIAATKSISTGTLEVWISP